MTRELILFWETSAQLRLPRCLAASRRVASRRVASRRVASRRVASRRVASRRVASRRILSLLSHPLIQDILRNTKREEEGVVLENITRYGARNFAFCCTVLLGLQPTTPTQKNILRRPSHCRVIKFSRFCAYLLYTFQHPSQRCFGFTGWGGGSKLKCFGFTGWVGGSKLKCFGFTGWGGGVETEMLRIYWVGGGSKLKCFGFTGWVGGGSKLKCFGFTGWVGGSKLKCFGFTGWVGGGRN